MIDGRDTTNFAEYINTLLLQYESDDLEFKSARGGFPGSFWETYSAFANSEGGLIVLGVAEKNQKFFIDNLSDEQVQKYTRDFWNNVNNPSTVSINLLNTDDLKVVEYNGNKVMLFYIRRAARAQRPVYLTRNPFGGTYKRNAEGDYRCSDVEVRRMVADSDEEHPADSRILKNYTLNDIDIDTLTRYRQVFKLSSPDHPWLSLNDLDLLSKLGGYRTDRQTGEEGFTMAGLLMFGKYESIMDEECCPHFFPDYREHLSDDEDIRWTNRICADGTWEANIFNFYQKVLPRLQSVLPKPFRLEDNIRREETPAHIAVREALINLCIHADYSINATLVVEHNTNGFVFSNPGTLLVSKDQYYAGGESVCRNKSLQKMFAMLGVAEKAGSGTDKIVKGWREANWRSPILSEKLQPDKVVLAMPMESLLSDKAKAELKEKFGITANTFDHKVLSVLALASDEGFVTNERLRYVLNLHKAEIAELLRALVNNKLLNAQGHGRGMRYFLPKSKSNVLGFNIASSSANIASSDANIASSDANIASSDANIASSDTNIASSDADIASPSPVIPAQNTHIMDLLMRQRLSRQKLAEVVEYFCSDWITIDDLATATGRSLSYMRTFIIPFMLKEKKLEMLYPGTPHHPKQKYKVVSN